MTDSAHSATSAGGQIQTCQNCGEQTAADHYIDAERLGIDWLCQSIHPRKDGTCGRDYSTSSDVLLPCRRPFGHRGGCGAR